MPRKKNTLSERDVRDESTVGHKGPSMEVTTTRDALVLDRQVELEAVAERHDGLVRQLFHMERFGLLLEYDPELAKTDNSPVFSLYQAKYNLLRDAPVAIASKTRGKQKEFFSSILNASPKKPIDTSAPDEVTLSTPARPLVRSGHRSTKRATNGHSQLFITPFHEAVMEGSVDSTVFLSQSKAPKRKHEAATPVHRDFSVHGDELLSLFQGVSLEDCSISARKRPRPSISQDLVAPAVSSRPQRVHRPPPRYRDDDASLPPIQAIRATSARATPMRATPSISSPLKGSEHQPTASSSRARTNKRNMAVTQYSESPPPSTSSPLRLGTPDFSHVRRVKLIVRHPPIAISHADQRPGPKPFYGQLGKLLRSYIVLDEEEETLKELEAVAVEEARIREKACKLKAQGKLRPTDMDIDSDYDEQRVRIFTPPSTDVWASLFEEAIERRDDMVAFCRTSERIRKQLVDLVDGRRRKGEEEVAAEERRLQRLAKQVMSMVTQQWKKAVHHIRQQQQVKHEEAERIRGQQHLDAILDQSEQILETQQVALTRADHSRSGSVSSGVTSDSDDNHRMGAEVDSEGGGDIELESVDSDDETDPGLESLLSITFLQRRRVHRKRRRQPSSAGASSVRSGSTEEQSRPSSPPTHISALSNLDHHGDSTTPVDDPMPPMVEDPLHNLPALSSSSSTTSHPSPPKPPDISDNEDEAHLLGEVNARSHSPASSIGIALWPVASLDLPCSPKTVDLSVASSPPPSQPDNLDAEPPPEMPEYLRAFATAAVRWDPEAKIQTPFLLRGTLRPYQQAGLEWLVSLHNGNTNGILADEMGLGKTIQTISLLAHLACNRGIWGPHLIVVPTSVILNWEMEFKKFLPGFKVLAYHGTAPRRKEIRKGWTSKNLFNVCITSYQLAAKDASIFKRKPWYYMILDEAHMIKNFKSQRWNTLLAFRSFRRLLLTGTPLQNNLTELWALLQFMMSGSTFAGLSEFHEWFSNPLEKAIETGEVSTNENQQRVSKLHSLLRPHLLRRLKKDVEKELPKKYEHLVLCPLSKRQRFLYDEFMSRRQTSDDLGSGMYYRIANILMQLRKVCNHPDLFEVRPIVTSFAMSHAAISDFGVTERFIRSNFSPGSDKQTTSHLPAFLFIDRVNISQSQGVEPSFLPSEALMGPANEPHEPRDVRTIVGFKRHQDATARARAIARRMDMNHWNRLRCATSIPVLSCETITRVRSLISALSPLASLDHRRCYLSTPHLVSAMVSTHSERLNRMTDTINHFAFATPPAVALDLPSIALAGYEDAILSNSSRQPELFDMLHRPAVKLQIAFPDASLLQYDCGKLQELHDLLRQRKAGGHRALIFTQMTKVLDILEAFLNLHGYLYLRLDGSTKIEDRQYITERFNSDSRIFCFISSSRSGGVGINLTGADTVIFYDSDFNPQMDRQCEDRAHRIGQIRDVHIYRFVSKYTIEEALLQKANQKRSLDDLVIQQGEFDWRMVFQNNKTAALTEALGAVEDIEDADAARAAAREANDIDGADADDFDQQDVVDPQPTELEPPTAPRSIAGYAVVPNEEENQEEEEEGGTVEEYMLQYVVREDEREYFEL